MATYMLLAIPAANVKPINAMIHVYNNEVLGRHCEGDNLHVGLSTDRREPPSRYWGGWWVEPAEMQFYQQIVGRPFVPPRGYPLDDGTTQRQVTDACAVLEVYPAPVEGYSRAQPEATRAAFVAARGQRPIERDIVRTATRSR